MSFSLDRRSTRAPAASDLRSATPAGGRVYTPRSSGPKGHAGRDFRPWETRTDPPTPGRDHVLQRRADDPPDALHVPPQLVIGKDGYPLPGMFGIVTTFIVEP